MLVLTRKVGQAIVIGDGIAIVTVLKSDRGELCLGIEAPRDVSVHRKEVYELIQREKDGGSDGGKMDD